MEDDAGICGYALALTDAKPEAAKIQVIQGQIWLISRIKGEDKLQTCFTVFCSLEGDKRGVPLPGHLPSAAPGHWSLSSQTND